MIKTPVQLRFHDMDMLGHMYNGQYTHIFDIGKSDFIQTALKTDFDWHDGIGFVNVSTTNNYYSQIKFGTNIEIQTTAEKIGTKSLTLLHKMVDVNSGEVKADSLCVLVCFDFRNQKSIAIPNPWREAVEKEISLK